VSQSVTISGEDRDLLYNRILVHLSGIDAVWLAAEEKDFQTAERVSQEYCDELHLVMDDLGWGERHEEETIELTSPPDVVRRVMERLRADADGLDEEEREIKAALLKREDENRRVRAACDQIIAALGRQKA
jgi:hypothetical protein